MEVSGDTPVDVLTWHFRHIPIKYISTVYCYGILFSHISRKLSVTYMYLPGDIKKGKIRAVR